MIKTIYLHENWGKLQEYKEEGKAESFEFSFQNFKIVYPFIKRKAGRVNGIQYYDLVTPRGELGPYIDLKEDQSLTDSFKQHLINHYKEAFLNYCQENNIIAEYVRFDGWNKNEAYFSSFYQLSPYGNIYCNDLAYDFFQEEYISSKRRNVRKALKEGVKVDFKSDSEALQKHMELHQFTYEKYKPVPYHQLDPYFIGLYIALLKNQVCFAQASYQDKVISSVLLLLGEDVVHYHFASHHPDYLSLNANALILYESALKAQRQGKRYFDLGTALKGSSLEKYKLGVSQPIKSTLGTAVRNPAIYQALIDQAGGPHLNYFPAYRHT